MSRLPEIFVKRIELPGGGHADACVFPDAVFSKAFSAGELRGFLKNCGIGSGGFQAGNDCAKRDGGTAVADSPKGKASAKVQAWAERKWGDEKAENGRTKAENFAEWFGDSTVVDQNGEPLVVYHGTRSDFTAFDPEQGGVASTESTKSFSKLGLFFAEKPEHASMFAERGKSEGPQNVMPVYLSGKMFEWDWRNQNARDISPGPRKGAMERAIQQIKDEGYGGVLWKGIEDRGGPQDQYMVFDPSQIKSATGNAGNFDQSESDIRKSTTFGKALSPADISQFLKSGSPDDDSENDDPDDRSLLMAEILFHVYGDDALSMLDGEYALKSWDESKYERDRDGKFKRKGAADTYQAAQKKIKTALKGKRTATSATELADILSGLTVAQLKELKAEYGIAASGRKAEFVQKIADRLDRGRREERKSRLKKVQKVKEPAQPEPEPEQPEPEAVEDTDDEPTAEELASMRPVQRVRALNRKHLDALRVKLATETSETQAGMEAAKAEVARARSEAEQVESEFRAVNLRYETTDMEALANPSDRKAKREYEKARKEYFAVLAKRGQAKESVQQAIWKSEAEADAHRRVTMKIVRQEIDAVNAEDGATERAKEAWKFVAGEHSSPLQAARGAAVAEDADKSVEDFGHWQAAATRKEGQEYLREVVNPRFHAKAITVPIAYEDGRAYARSKTEDGFKQAHHVGLSKRSSTDTFVHEFAHAIEDDNGEVRAYMNEFLSLRVGSEKLTSLSVKFPDVGYEIYEYGRRDDFRKAVDAVYSDLDESERDRKAYYIGKKYKKGATEVLSMGLEMMYENATAFAKADPEYFDLVVGVVSGRILKNGRQVR